MSVIRQWFCVVALAASAWAANPAPPNIILITLDTTRADRMGFLGSKRGLTPNLDLLARQSVVFTRAYAQAPLTPVSHATILTGTYPQFHQVNDFRVPLAKDLPYAPDILQAHGYHTAAFVGSIVLQPPTYAPGFDRGFDSYDANFHYAGPREKHYHTVERRGGEVVAHALAWLNKHPQGPFFLWVHLYDPHDPYDPPEPYKTRYAKELYDGEIAYMDSALGKLFGGLKARGLYDGAVVAVMADHGESLGAHGEDTHGVFLYDETIRVPLVIRLPRVSSKRVESRVELVDVLPTLLQAVGVDVPAEVQGQSLLGIMKAGAAGNGEADASRDRPAYAETDYPHVAFGWSAERSLRTGKYLYIQAPRQELYDETADPDALHNLSGTSTAVSSTLSDQVNAFRAKTSNAREAPKAAVDPTAPEKLAALGYISGSPAKAGTTGQEADPKDKIEISNLAHRASVLRENGNFKEAAALLQQIIAKDPGITGMYAKLGDNLLDAEEYEEALPVLRKAMELEPDSPMSHFRLAKGLMGTGDFAAAVPELEFAIGKMPNFADAHVFLEMAYARTGRVPDTIRECKIVLEFLPNHYGSYLILGRFLEMSGDLEGAVPNLKKAAALQPNAPDPHIILADVYDHLGREADADRERAEARRLGAGSR
jgi:arylsulfatase A-like enzyme/Tfp pilus assembly protein PilF